MKSLNTIFIALAILSIGTVANAQTEVPNLFETGDAALATEVNANFDALIDAIDALSAEVDALQAVAPTNSVAGRTYTIQNIRGFTEDQETGDTNTPVHLLNIGGTDADLTFGANGTVTIGTQIGQEIDIGWSATDGTPFIGAIQESEDAGATVNYTQDGGAIDIPDFGLELYASKDGSILVFANRGQELSDDDNDERFGFELGLLVELDIAQ